MGKKKSLYSGGSRSIASKQIREKTPTNQTIDNSKAELEKRLQERTRLPYPPLKISRLTHQAGKTYFFNYDFEPLTDHYPHHKNLVRQLMVGAELVLPRSTTGYNTVYDKYYAIQEFVEFLNDGRGLLNEPVSNVADISITVAMAFRSYLISNFPLRYKNQKRYIGLRQIVNVLQKQYPDNPIIGTYFPWPRAPKPNIKPVEGYTPDQMEALAKACQKDILSVMELHRIYDRIEEISDPIHYEEWNLENLMHHIHHLVTEAPFGHVLPSAVIKAAIRRCKPARKFVIAENLSPDEVVALYEKNGERLAKNGHYPMAPVRNLENLMFHLHGYVHRSRDNCRKTRSTESIIRMAFRSSESTREFLAECSLDVDEVIGIYLERGPQLAAKGKDPYDVDWDLENLMHYLKEQVERNSGRRLPHETIRRWFRMFEKERQKKTLEAVQDLGYSLEEIIEIYETEGESLARKGRSPFSTPINQTPDPERAESQFLAALATLKIRHPDYPYYMSMEKAQLLFPGHSSLRKEIPKDRTGKMVWKIMLAMEKARYKPMDSWGNLKGRNLIWSSMHFVLDTIYPFLLLVLINTGWNPESILAISADVDSHITEDLLDPDKYVIIWSEKRRGQGKLKGPREVSHRSHKNRKFGTYALLKYVEAIVKRYQDSPYLIPTTLWQCTSKSWGPKAVDVIMEVGFLQGTPHMRAIMKTFLHRHGLVDLFEEIIIHQRIRSGYVTVREAQGLTEFEIASDLDHKDAETADTLSIHYASDASSNAIKDMKITELQKQFMEDMSNLRVRVVESTSLRDLCDAINSARTDAERSKSIQEASSRLNITEKTITRLISPGAQKYITACEDSTKPTWPGNDSFINKGASCKFFSKCCLCEQSVIFPEALPYIARRIFDLEKLRQYFSPAEWLMNHGDEHEAWKTILDRWNNPEQVDEALKLAKTGKVVLPHVLRGA